MTKHVYVPNVAVSLVPLSKEDVIQKISAAPPRSSGAEDQLFFRIPSDNIISFTHEYLFSKSKQENIGNEIDLVFIDPENLFIKKFVGNNLGAKKADLLQRNIKQQQQTEALSKQELRNKITQLQDNVVGLQTLKTETGLTDDKINTAFTSQNQGTVTIDKEGQIDYDPTKLRKITADDVKKLLAAANLPAEASVEVSANPSPYLYFYYGLGNSPSEWAGPVAAQMVAAKYDYSPAEGRKQIQMRFTSTYDFAGFSYLSLDTRGVTTAINPSWVCAVRFKDNSANKGSVFGANDPILGSLDFGVLNTIHEACLIAIKNYLQAATSPEINVVSILPDFGKIIETKIKAYKDQRTDYPNSGTIYTMFEALASLGFDVAILNEDDINGKIANLRIGDLVTLKTQKNVSISDPRFRYEENFNARIRGNSGPKILAIRLKKEPLETFSKPILRLCDGISNSLGSKTFEKVFEVYDDPKGLVPYFKRIDDLYKNKYADLEKQRNTVYSLRKDNDSEKPTLIFGDREFLEFLLYGKAVQAAASTGNVQQFLGILGSDLSNFDKDCFNKFYVTNAADIHLFPSTVEDQFTFPSRQYELSNAQAQALAESKIFYLRYGIQEPNVLDFDININDFFFSLLSKLNIETDKLNIIIDSPGELITLESFTDKNQIEQIAKELEIADAKFLDQDLINKIKEELKKRNQSPTKDELVKIILYYSTLTKKGKENRITIPISAAQGQDLAFYSMIKQLIKIAYTGTIKTLPAFRFSRVPTSLPMALLIANDPKIVPYSKGQEDSIIKALNGFWTIIGFRHVISKDDVFSEFSVIKQYRLLDSALFNPVPAG